MIRIGHVARGVPPCLGRAPRLTSHWPIVHQLTLGHHVQVPLAEVLALGGDASLGSLAASALAALAALAPLLLLLVLFLLGGGRSGGSRRCLRANGS